MIETTICGIPCRVKVTHRAVVKPNFRAESDWDYRGYTELEYEVLDRKGYKAPWLERKLNSVERARLEEAICAHYS
jgi:hypothetical protein